MAPVVRSPTSRGFPVAVTVVAGLSRNEGVPVTALLAMAVGPGILGHRALNRILAEVEAMVVIAAIVLPAIVVQSQSDVPEVMDRPVDHGWGRRQSSSSNSNGTGREPATRFCRRVRAADASAVCMMNRGSSTHSPDRIASARSGLIPAAYRTSPSTTV